MGNLKKREAAPANDTAPVIVRERNDFTRFMMLNQAVAVEVASGRLHLTNTELRVWFALIAQADTYNYVRERSSWMADEFGIARPSFSVALAGLRKKDMVIRLRDKGSGQHLMLSPFHFWKGPAKEHKAGIRTYLHLAKATLPPAKEPRT